MAVVTWTYDVMHRLRAFTGLHRILHPLPLLHRCSYFVLNLLPSCCEPCVMLY